VAERITKETLDEIMTKWPDSDLAHHMARQLLAYRESGVLELIRRLRQRLGVIDNGKCAVCRVGYRAWKLPDCEVPDGPCSNEACLSRKIDVVIANLEALK